MALIKFTQKECRNMLSALATSFKAIGDTLDKEMLDCEK